MAYVEKLFSPFQSGRYRALTISRRAASKRIAAIVCVIGMIVGLQSAVCEAESSNNDSLRLSMISGDGKRLLATINGETFAIGEKHKVMIANRRVAVQCLEIHDGSADV